MSDKERSELEKWNVTMMRRGCYCDCICCVFVANWVSWIRWMLMPASVKQKATVHSTDYSFLQHRHRHHHHSYEHVLLNLVLAVMARKVNSYGPSYSSRDSQGHLDHLDHSAVTEYASTFVVICSIIVFSSSLIRTCVNTFFCSFNLADPMRVSEMRREELARSGSIEIQWRLNGIIG